MTQRPSTPPATDVAIELMQQEVSQRLLAIRMNTALHSRQSEGRKTQALADQTVGMVDEVISIFNQMLTLMQLSLTDGSRDMDISCRQLVAIMENMIGVPCELSGEDVLAAHSADVGEKVFRLLYRSVLCLLLKPAKIRRVCFEICDASLPSLVVAGEGGEAAFDHLQSCLEGAGGCRLERENQEKQVVLRVLLTDGGEASS